MWVENTYKPVFYCAVRGDNRPLQLTGSKQKYDVFKIKMVILRDKLQH